MLKEQLDEILKTSVLMAHFRLTNMTVRKHVPIGGSVYFWTVWPESLPNEVFLLYGPDGDPHGTPVDIAPLSDAAQERMTALGEQFTEWFTPLLVHQQFAFSLRAELKVMHYERPSTPTFPTSHLPN